jgi:hypothetical protein
MSKRIPQDPTLQELFDFVAQHLLTQGDTAMQGSAPILRNNEGQTCAVGCLIEPRRLNLLAARSPLEGEDERTPRILRALVDSLGLEGLYAEALALLADLRRVHDDWPSNEWPWRLRKVAEEHGLDPIGDEP